jgi:hypothetical protein
MEEHIFNGSYIDGCNVDIPKWCGLILTPEQEEKLWEDINETDLLEGAGGYVDITRQDDGNVPGMDDTYYSVSCSDVEEFKASLRKFILEVIGERET